MTYILYLSDIFENSDVQAVLCSVSFCRTYYNPQQKFNTMLDWDVCASFWCLVFITVSPSIRGSEEVSPLTVIEGSLITLVCESSGIPPPSLTWRKDGTCVSVFRKKQGDVNIKRNILYGHCVMHRTLSGWHFYTAYLACVSCMSSPQGPSSNQTNGSESCQGVASCRSPVLRGRTQPPIRARPPVQPAPHPRSTVCRFMVRTGL